MRPHRLGVVSRFVLVVLTGVLLVASALGALTFLESRLELVESSTAGLLELTASQAARLDSRMARTAGRTEGLASSLEVLDRLDEAQLLALLRRNLVESPDVFGTAAAFAPYAFDPGRRLYAPYLYRDATGIAQRDLGAPTYDYPVWDWYLVPALLGRSVWSEPYFDEGGGGVLMTTYSAPAIVDGEVRAVVTADLSLAYLTAEVRQLEVGSGGWAFVLSSRGTFLAAPRTELIMKESIFSFAERLGRPDIAAVGQRMTRGEAGIVRLPGPQDGKPVWLAFSPVTGAGFSYGAVIPEAEVMAPAWRLARRQGLVALAGLAGLALVIWLLVAGLTRPLRGLAQAARTLAGGDFGVRVQGVRPGDELGDLAVSFNQMVEDLLRHLEELETTTAAKERIESELNLARQIQESILPRTYPPYPERDDLDLFGRTVPARQVGGDFYDYFPIGEEHLGLVVGDVSGKGVPSALFMTVARTLVKSAAAHHRDPVAVLAEANRQILPGNELCMFVTVFYGVYHPASGALCYTLAGHPPPLLRSADGAITHLPAGEGMAVGVHEPLELESHTITLAPGDVLLAFTDGLDEAVDTEVQAYGVERAEQWLRTAAPAPAPQMIQDLIDDQRRFTGDVEPFDDLTLLVLKRTC